MLRQKSEQKRTYAPRRPAAKYRIAEGTVIDYKDFNTLRKYISDRGKILSRRITGASAKQQRMLCREIKKARFLGLVSASAFQK